MGRLLVIEQTRNKLSYNHAQRNISCRRNVVHKRYTGNDIRNNHRVLEGSPYRPYFVLRNQRLVLDDSFSRLPDFAADAVSWNRTRSRWINRSRTLQVAAQAYKQVRAMSAGAGQAEVAQPATTTHSIEPGVHDAILRPPTNKYWRDAWRVTEALLLQMSREVDERGKDFMVATLTIGIQVNPNKSERTRFMQRLGIASLDYPDRRIAAFTASHGIQTVTLLDDFRCHAEARGVFLHGFNDRGTGHWNANGHRLAGKLIARRICQSKSTEQAGQESQNHVGRRPRGTHHLRIKCREFDNDGSRNPGLHCNPLEYNDKPCWHACCVDKPETVFSRPALTSCR